ncbi:MAG: hypothetical protein CL607_27245 [Anaerolineaceae bacterium]|nr:hypothetical protein [Anaerolineaceae bacterium]
MSLHNLYLNVKQTMTNRVAHNPYTLNNIFEETMKLYPILQWIALNWLDKPDKTGDFGFHYMDTYF